ncbi:MAG: MBL fold metallo-hydrolase [Dehalococcoidia bacterium]
MATEIPFVRDFRPEHGKLEEVAPGLRRIVAPNAGPFTFRGTNTYVIGTGEVAVVDPGPEDEGHLRALLEALEGETVTHILITHTHRDHSPGAAALKLATGAPTHGFGPHMTAGSGDEEFRPDKVLDDGAVVTGRGWAVQALHTPGHCANHLAYAMLGTDGLLSGDHVMAWSTTVVKPPDGDMTDYMASLRRLRGRPEGVFWPGHGPGLRDPRGYVDALAKHREERDRQILECLAEGPKAVPAIVEQVYPGLDAKLLPAAAQTAHAHLLHLMRHGRVMPEGPPDADSLWRRS